MFNIQIPKDHLKSLRWYFSLNGDIQEKLNKTLQDVKVGSSSSEIASVLKEKLEIETEQALDFVGFLFSILMAFEKIELANRDEFIQSVATSFVESENDFVYDQTLESLRALFTVKDAMIVWAKAQELAVNREKLLRSSKIITDIRPVFTDKESDSFSSAVVLFTLRLEYIEDGEDKISYFALDKSDLNRLKAQIERAEKKEELINDKMSSNSVNLIEY
ncbi:MAG: hypothetical protein ACPGLV_00495 [Bacteroidia bacterium]